MMVSCSRMKNRKASNFCSLTQSVGFVCSGLITWCCTIQRCYLTVPEEDLISLLDWHITVMNCYSEPNKKCLESHRVHAINWDRLLKGKEKLRRRDNTIKSSLSGAEVEHRLLIFSFTSLPFSLNPPCLKDRCNMIVSTCLVSFLRLIDFLVSLYHIYWQPESPLEALVSKLDFQRKGPEFHPAYLPCRKTVQSLMLSQEWGIIKQKIQSFCHQEFLFQAKHLMAILIFWLLKWTKPWTWTQIQSKLEQSVPCHTPKKHLYLKSFLIPSVPS